VKYLTDYLPKCYPSSEFPLRKYSGICELYQLRGIPELLLPYLDRSLSIYFYNSIMVATVLVYHPSWQIITCTKVLDIL